MRSCRSYKSARPAYQLGANTLGLERSEVLFVAFAGWDVAAAVWFEYPKYWLNRLASVTEELDAVPLGTGTDLQSLFAFLAPRVACAGMAIIAFIDCGKLRPN
jgi:2-haloacid dehalogenase